MKKIITFVNRTWKQLTLAFIELQHRYKHVKLIHYLKSGLFSGSFEVVTYKDSKRRRGDK